jgi:hypothetical protein
MLCVSKGINPKTKENKMKNNKLPAEIKLCDLPDTEFISSGEIGRLIASAGYFDSATSVIGAHHWWGLTVLDLEKEIESMRGNQEQYRLASIRRDVENESNF